MDPISRRRFVQQPECRAGALAEELVKSRQSSGYRSGCQTYRPADDRQDFPGTINSWQARLRGSSSARRWATRVRFGHRNYKGPNEEDLGDSESAAKAVTSACRAAREFGERSVGQRCRIVQ